MAPVKLIEICHSVGKVTDRVPQIVSNGGLQRPLIGSEQTVFQLSNMLTFNGFFVDGMRAELI